MSIKVKQKELSQFLVRAKIATYASGSDEFVTPAAQINSHQLEYMDGKLLYRDLYFGGLHFIGIETVFQDEQPIWGMSYYGGVIPGSSDLQIAGMSPVLKAALRELPIEAPFRGPSTFHQDDYQYENAFHGHLFNFHGIEVIRHQKQAIYRLHYSGGMVE